eukprot:gene12600-8638_t
MPTPPKVKTGQQYVSVVLRDDLFAFSSTSLSLLHSPTHLAYSGGFGADNLYGRPRGSTSTDARAAAPSSSAPLPPHRGNPAASRALRQAHKSPQQLNTPTLPHPHTPDRPSSSPPPQTQEQNDDSAPDCISTPAPRHATRTQHYITFIGQKGGKKKIFRTDRGQPFYINAKGNKSYLSEAQKAAMHSATTRLKDVSKEVGVQPFRGLKVFGPFIEVFVPLEVFVFGPFRGWVEECEAVVGTIGLGVNGFVFGPVSGPVVLVDRKKNKKGVRSLETVEVLDETRDYFFLFFALLVVFCLVGYWWWAPLHLTHTHTHTHPLTENEKIPFWRSVEKVKKKKMVNRRLARSARLKHKKRKITLSKKQSRPSEENEQLAAPARRIKTTSASIRVKKAASGSSTAVLSPANSTQTVLRTLKKRKSDLLKRQAVERMVLKERLRELNDKKNRLRKGENVKAERRELSRYIRQLQEQLQQRHTSDLQSVEQQMVDARREAARHGRGDEGRRRGRVWLPSGIPATLYRHSAQPEEDEGEWEDEDSDGEGEGQQEDTEEVIRMFAHLTA